MISLIVLLWAYFWVGNMACIVLLQARLTVREVIESGVYVVAFPLGIAAVIAKWSREESEMKQLAYERGRAKWRKAHPERDVGPVTEELDPEG